MTHFDDDVPPGVDFLSEDAARKWADEAEEKLGSRINFFAAFVDALTGHTPRVRSVLELGSGPGLLAEYILSRCAVIERYTLLDFSQPMLNMSRTRLQGLTAVPSHVNDNGVAELAPPSSIVLFDRKGKLLFRTP